MPSAVGVFRKRFQYQLYAQRARVGRKRWQGSGGGPQTYPATLTAGLTPNAALVGQARKILAAGVTPTGTTLARPQKILVGGLTPAATTIERPQKTLAGGLTPTAVIAKRPGRSLTAGLTPVGGAFGVGYAGAVIQDNPVGYWRLGEPSGTTAADATGNGHGGTYTGGYTLAQAGALARDTDGAVALNGSTGYVTVPNHAAWDLPGDFTVECWVKLATTAPARQTFVGHDNGAGNNPKWMFWLESGQLNFFHHIANTLTYPVTGAWSPTVGVWYHLAVTRSGNNYVIYVDGTSFATGTNAVAIPAATAALEIGRAEANFYLSGSIDEVAIYPTALSGARITAHRNAALAATGASVSLTAVLAPTAAVVFQARRVLAAGLTPTAAVTRRTARSLTAALTPTSVVVRRGGKTLAAGLTPAATLVAAKVALLSLAATLTPAATLVKRSARVLAASLVPTATVTWRAGRVLTAGLTPTAAVLRRASKPLAAGLTPTTVLVATKVALLSLAAGLTPSATVVRRTARVLTAGLTPTAALVRRTGRNLAASLVPAATVLRRASKGLTATLTPAATLATAKVVLRTFTAGLTPTAVVVRRSTRLLAASLTPTAGLTRRLTRSLAAGLAPTGAVVQRLSRGLSAALQPVAGLATTLIGPIPPIKLPARAVLGAATNTVATLSSLGPTRVLVVGTGAVVRVGASTARRAVVTTRRYLARIG